MTLDQELDELARRGGGRITVRPRDGQDLEAFKVTIASLKRYSDEGRLQIVREHRESHTGNRYVDSVTVQLDDDWSRS
jgi:hypothetical protein